MQDAVETYFYHRPLWEVFVSDIRWAWSRLDSESFAAFNVPLMVVRLEEVELEKKVSEGAANVRRPVFFFLFCPFFFSKHSDPWLIHTLAKCIFEQVAAQQRSGKNSEQHDFVFLLNRLIGWFLPVRAFLALVLGKRISDRIYKERKKKLAFKSNNCAVSRETSVARTLFKL